MMLWMVISSLIVIATLTYSDFCSRCDCELAGL
jgi:hypothetical protein